MSNGTRRVLVTGASGLIGSHVVQALLEAGYQPRALSRGPLPAELPPVEHARADIRDRAALDAAVSGCSAVIHTAAVYSYAGSDAEDMLSTNIEGTRNVLDAAQAAGIGRVVVTSSCATCGPVPGRPADERDSAPDWELRVPYKHSKVSAERLALDRSQAGLDVVVVNPTTTVGAWDRRPTPSGRMVLDVLERRIRGYIATGGLNVVAAQDVAQGHVLALERGRGGERYLLGGEDLAMGELFALVARLGGIPAPRFAVPYRVALGSAYLLDRAARCLRREPKLVVLDEVRLARWPMYFSSAKAQSDLGYSSRSVEEALVVAVDWFKRFSPMTSREPSRGSGGRTGWGRPPVTLGAGAHPGADPGGLHIGGTARRHG